MYFLFSTWHSRDTIGAAQGGADQCERCGRACGVLEGKLVGDLEASKYMPIRNGLDPA